MSVQAEHHVYVEDVVLRKALIDIWRAVCMTCRWQGPKRYSRLEAVNDVVLHRQSTATHDAAGGE